ncbi:hypothetical protein NP233_g7749 [Leucocoprinus birnbaumii]|uniref:Uncharacterized protein n=1 Tax=Leucocoprinus birnbaumii TaxID=56174 RepID=A0AAD5VNR1_9AGAR|nr:hypothetical protein NP233_g7749 [Leucocoprinus birnbaumii]
MGGPTGEIHLVDDRTGGFGQKIQEVLFVPEAQLPQADKTRAALRYGSHGVESTSTPEHSLTFILESSHIFIPLLRPGLEAHDGPRHVKVHPNGKILYCVTEHSNFVDLYEIISGPNTSVSSPLKYINSRSLLPRRLASGDMKQFRGDTLMLTPPTHTHPSPYALFTTTRGSTPATRGWMSIFALDGEGYFVDQGQKDTKGHPLEVEIRYETSSSGGKANAIDLLTKHKIPLAGPLLDEDDVAENGDGDDFEGSGTVPPRRVYLNSPFKFNSTRDQKDEWEEDDEGVWVLLTDDDETTAAGADLTSSMGGVKVLEWGGWGQEGVHLIAEWPGRRGFGEGVQASWKAGEDEERMKGGSHAIWLI